MEYIEVMLTSVYVEQGVRDDPPPVEFPKEVIRRLKQSNDLAKNVDKDPDELFLPDGTALEDVKRISDVYFRRAPRPVLEVLTDPRYRNVVILGDPGAGKSTLTRYITLALIGIVRPPVFADAFAGYVPLLIELKGFAAFQKKASVHQGFLDYFELLRQTEGHYPGKDSLHEYLIEDGKAIVIFDGLDEIFDPQERDKMSLLICRFRDTYPLANIIITSRIIGFKPGVLTDRGFRCVTIQDLDEIQIREFAGKWYTIALADRPDKIEERVDALLQAVVDSPSIRQLAGNPLLLTIMAILGRSQELPRERWKLYDHAASVLIDLWDVHRHLAREDLYVDAEDKREMLQTIALRMQGGDNGMAGNFITDKALQREFEQYLIARYQEPPLQAKGISLKMIQQLHERNFILSLYGAKLYGFVHRAFLEYFCAASIVYDFQSSQKLSLERLKNEVFIQYSSEQSWHEVLRLVAGMIDPSFAGDIIVSLIEGEDISTDRRYPQYTLRQALALKCLAEIKKIHLLTGPSQKLLQGLCRFFWAEMRMRSPVYFTYFRKEILPFVELIGPSWPGREILSDILISSRTDKEGPRLSYIYDELYGSFIGHIGKGSPEILEAVMGYARDDDPRHRVTAPFALATGWHDDPSTYPLLCKMAEEDEAQTVCYAAIYALSEHFSERTEVLPSLKRWARHSPHDFGRAAAITGLASHFAGQPEVFAIIQAAGLKESEKYPRTIAIKSLGDFFHQYEETFTLLCHAALHDLSPGPSEREEEEDPRSVRHAAVVALANYWPDRPETLAVLADREKKEPNNWLREKCSKLLLQLKVRLITSITV